MISTYFADTRALLNGRGSVRIPMAQIVLCLDPIWRLERALYRVRWQLRLKGNHKVTRLEEPSSFLASEYHALCTLCVYNDVFDCSPVATFLCSLSSPASPAFP